MFQNIARWARCRSIAAKIGSGANRGAVDVVVPALGHRFGESDRDALPNTGGAPSPKAPVDRIPVAVLLRHVAPGAPVRSRHRIPLMMLRLSSGGRPRPRLPGSRSTGNKTLRIRHSTSVRSPRLKAASSNLAASNQFENSTSMILSTRPRRQTRGPTRDIDFGS